MTFAAGRGVAVGSSGFVGAGEAMEGGSGSTWQRMPQSLAYWWAGVPSHTISDSSGHSAKAWSPMNSTPAGMSTLSSAEQHAKACSSIMVTLSGRTTVFSVRQSINAALPMAVTTDLPIFSGIISSSAAP